jgi:hypothetical protein
LKLALRARIWFEALQLNGVRWHHPRIIARRSPDMLARVAAAIRGCAWYSFSIFLTYVVSAAVGASMAHGGNRYALDRRDAMVGRAGASDRASIEYREGHRVRAALADATANVTQAALPQTLAGLTVVLPYVSVARQGWAGGIVSVDGGHRSRLRSARGAAYYLGTLLLQFLAFSLCIGGGIRAGVALYRRNRDVGWRLWRYRLPRPILADASYVIASSIPLFLLASCFEFLSPWNV